MMKINSLFVTPIIIKEPKLRLFCFPFAGGSINTYLPWKDHFKTEIELVSKARTLFHQSVLNSKNDTLICEGVVEVCYIDNNSGRPKVFPDRLLNLFKN